MKKILIILMTFLFAGIVFADSYKVVDVVGKVYTGNNLVEIGQILNDEDVLNVRPQAKITLQLIDKTEKRTYKQANNKIAVKEAWVMSAIGKQGLKKGTIASSKEIAPAVESTRKGVATAASRASEAKEDFTWDE